MYLYIYIYIYIYETHLTFNNVLDKQKIVLQTHFYLVKYLAFFTEASSV